MKVYLTQLSSMLNKKVVKSILLSKEITEKQIDETGNSSTIKNKSATKGTTVIKTKYFYQLE